MVMMLSPRTPHGLRIFAVDPVHDCDLFSHGAIVTDLTWNPVGMDARAAGLEEEHAFLLSRVQPALIGLIGGSLSTLAPIFAVALSTEEPHIAFFTGSPPRSAPR